MHAPDPSEIEALAASPALLARARALADGEGWRRAGRSDRAAWADLASRSGRALRVVVRPEPRPSARCTCGRAGCEHGLALLLVAAERREALPRAEEPDWARAWLDAPAEGGPRARGPSKGGADAARAAERRAAVRQARMLAGVEQLEAWLDEVALGGVARLAGARGAQELEAEARRLVDAQLPGLAGRARAAALAAAAGEVGWADAAVDALGLAALAAAGLRREGELPPGLRHDVRAAVGLPTREADVLARGERVRGAFWVLGARVILDARLDTRRTWLLGEDGRLATLLDFRPPLEGEPFAPRPGLEPGARAGLTLALHPSAAPLRASLAGDVTVLSPTAPPAEPPSALLERAAAALARSPFVARVAAVLDAAPSRGAPRLGTDEGSLPVTHGDWQRLSALSGGARVRVACEWDGRSLALLGAWAEGGYHALAGPRVAPDPPRPPSALRGALLAGVRPGALRRPAGLGLADADTTRPGAAFALAAAEGNVERAGATLGPALAPPPLAPDDERPPPRAAASAVLEALLSDGPAELLAEALALLARRGLRLPHAALPAALSVGDPRTRARVRPLLDARGRWLASALDAPAWAWARDEARAVDEERFARAAPAERLELLGRARTEGLAVARAFAEEILRGEAPERRRAAVEALADGLGPDDEPLLERARADRSPAVRAAAVELLARLFGSDVARAARERAERYVPASLAVRLPGPAFDPRWAEAGVREEPPAGWGKRAFWLAQVLALAPPSHLAARLRAEPDDVVARCDASDARAALLEGLARGALRFRERAYFRPLLRAHAARPWPPALVPALPLALLPRLAEPARTEEALAALDRPGTDPVALVATLPRPHPTALAERLLRALAAEEPPPELFPLVALGLPAPLLGVRLAPPRPRTALDRARARFDATAELRQRIVSVLRP